MEMLDFEVWPGPRSSEIKQVEGEGFGMFCKWGQAPKHIAVKCYTSVGVTSKHTADSAGAYYVCTWF